MVAASVTLTVGQTKSVTLTNTGPKVLTWSVRRPEWVTVKPASGKLASGKSTAFALTTSMAQGRNGTLTVSWGGGSVTIGVSVKAVVPEPAPEIEPVPVPEIEPVPVPEIEPEPVPEVEPVPVPEVEPVPVPVPTEPVSVGSSAIEIRTSVPVFIAADSVVEPPPPTSAPTGGLYVPSARLGVTDRYVSGAPCGNAALPRSRRRRRRLG